MFLYVGGYTKAPNGHADGIGVYRFDEESGALEQVQVAGDVTNPSFLALGHDGRFLYAVAEASGEGSVIAYARDPETGKLQELNRESSRGNGPCYVSVDHSGRYVLVANYGSGSIAALPIGADGRVGAATSAVQHEGSSVNPERQEGPHAHMIASSPEGNFVFATDLGMDRVMAYRLDTSTGKLEPAPDPAGATSAPGAGPRHFAFAPDGRTMYVINELGCTLTVYDYDAATGQLTLRQTLPTLPEDFHDYNLCAHVMVSPDGRFVYGSNRGHDSIVVWAVDAASGELSLVKRVPAGGKTPRNFTLSPDGSWLLVANMDSDNVVVSRRDAASGLPEEPGTAVEIPSACCLVFGGG